MKYSIQRYNKCTIILHRFVKFAPIIGSILLKFNTRQYPDDVCCMTCIKIQNNCKIAISSRCAHKLHSLLKFNQ